VILTVVFNFCEDDQPVAFDIDLENGLMFANDGFLTEGQSLEFMEITPDAFLREVEGTQHRTQQQQRPYLLLNHLSSVPLLPGPYQASLQ